MHIYVGVCMQRMCIFTQIYEVMLVIMELNVST